MEVNTLNLEIDSTVNDHTPVKHQTKNVKETLSEGVGGVEEEDMGEVEEGEVEEDEALREDEEEEAEGEVEEDGDLEGREAVMALPYLQHLNRNLELFQQNSRLKLSVYYRCRRLL
mmetsp:Transcript_2558/g.3695  ORF Transcript_2558/g.3695 Transcript_2558/m.3695 type:complete len:116 (-) Transcript_2558:5-352(-)